MKSYVARLEWMAIIKGCSFDVCAAVLISHCTASDAITALARFVEASWPSCILDLDPDILASGGTLSLPPFDAQVVVSPPRPGGSRPSGLIEWSHTHRHEADGTFARYDVGIRIDAPGWDTLSRIVLGVEPIGLVRLIRADANVTELDGCVRPASAQRDRAEWSTPFRGIVPAASVRAHVEPYVSDRDES